MNETSFTLSVCRLCAREDDESNLINLSDEDIGQIRTCLHIDINSASHSKSICCLCKLNVNFVYKFYKFCQEADVKLTLFLKKSQHDSSGCGSDEMDVNPRDFIKQETPEMIEDVPDLSDLQDGFETAEDIDTSNDLISIIEQMDQSGHESYELELGEIPDIEDDLDNFQFDDEDNEEQIEVLEAEGVEKNANIRQRNPRRKGGLYVCEACDEICPSYRTFYEHLKTHENKRYQCRQCFKWFKQRYVLREHLMIHTGNIPTCKDCGRQYEVRGNLSRHIRAVHENLSRYVCPKCDAVFTQSNALKNHLVVHERERTFECDICAKRFKSQMYLNLHTSRIHDTVRAKNTDANSDTEKERRCNFCERISDNVMEHKKHLLEHASERPFCCEICGKRFRLENIYKSHLLVHTDQTPYKCSHCDKTFTELVLLNGHESTHIGKKKLFCDICGKVFLTIGHYNVHVRRHAGVKPYDCDLCDGKFYSRSLLRTHKHSKHKAETKKAPRSKKGGPVKLDYRIMKQLDNFDDMEGLESDLFI